MYYLHYFLHYLHCHFCTLQKCDESESHTFCMGITKHIALFTTCWLVVEDLFKQVYTMPRPNKLDALLRRLLNTKSYAG